MKSHGIFPLEQRLNSELFFENNSYTSEEINILLFWMKKYHDALLITEEELTNLGTEVIYSKQRLPEHRRMNDGMQITLGKFGYFALIKILNKYQLALKEAESQLQALSAWV